MTKLVLASVLSFGFFGCNMLMPTAPAAGNTTAPTESSLAPGGGTTSTTSAVEPTSPAAAPATPAAAPAGPVSVTLRSSCKNTVRVFYGQKPKFGSGTTSSLSGNSVQSKSMKPGEMVWLVDDKDNGLASATVSETTRTIEVNADCTSLR